MSLAVVASPNPQAQDVALQAARFEEMRAERANADGESRANVLEEHREWLDTLRQQSPSGVTEFYEAARSVAKSSASGLPAFDRAQLLHFAADHAPSLERRDRCLWSAFRTLIIAEHLQAARELAERVLPELAEREPGGQQRPYLLLEVARVYTELRDATSAHAVLDVFERDVPASEHTHHVNARGLRGEIFVGAGCPDLAQPLILASREGAEALVPADGPANATLDAAWQREIEFFVSIFRPSLALDRLDVLQGDPRWLQLPPARRAWYELARAVALNQAWTVGATGPTPVAAYTAALELAEAAGAEASDVVLRIRLAWARFELRFGDRSRARALLEQTGYADRAGGGDAPVIDVKASTLLAYLDRVDGADADRLRSNRDRLAREFDVLLEQWARQPVAQSGAGFFLYDERRELLAELCRYELLLNESAAGHAAAIGRFVAAQEQGRLSRRIGTKGSLTLESIQGDLEVGEGLLVYLPTTPLGSLVFAVDREGVVVGEVEGWDTLRPRRETYLACLTQAIDAPERWKDNDERRSQLVREERSSAHALAAGLLPPEVATRLGAWTRVSITGMDGMGFVPFVWLPLGEERFLGLDRAITTVPSLPVWSSRRGLKRSYTKEYVLVGGSEIPSATAGPLVGLPDLPLPARDAARLTELFDGDALVLSGDAATRTALTASTEGGVTLLHFLLHGVFDPRRTRPAALAMTPISKEDDGLFSCEHAEDTRAEADTVLLTACRSAVGPERRGDANAGDLAGAFLIGGARTVVVSHSDLHYGQALESSSRIVRALRREGRSPADALRAEHARLARLHDGTAPFRIGLFEVIGDGHTAPYAALHREKDRSYTLAVTVALLAIVVAGWVIGRRQRSA